MRPGPSTIYFNKALVAGPHCACRRPQTIRSPSVCFGSPNSSAATARLTALSLASGPAEAVGKTRGSDGKWA